MITKFAKNSEVKMIVEEKQIATNQFKRFLSKKGIFSSRKEEVKALDHVSFEIKK